MTSRHRMMFAATLAAGFALGHFAQTPESRAETLYLDNVRYIVTAGTISVARADNPHERVELHTFLRHRLADGRSEFADAKVQGNGVVSMQWREFSN